MIFTSIGQRSRSQSPCMLNSCLIKNLTAQDPFAIKRYRYNKPTINYTTSIMSLHSWTIWSLIFNFIANRLWSVDGLLYLGSNVKVTVTLQCEKLILTWLHASFYVPTKKHLLLTVKPHCVQHISSVSFWQEELLPLCAYIQRVLKHSSLDCLQLLDQVNLYLCNSGGIIFPNS